MLIRVVYRDERFDFVKPVLLNELLYLNMIKKFRRSEGWVNPVNDKIRGTGGHYRGPERRNEMTV